MTDQYGIPASIVEGEEAYQKHLTGGIAPLSSGQLSLTAACG